MTVTTAISDKRATRQNQWFDDILEGRADRIDRAFDPTGAVGPTTLWTPRTDDAQTLPIRHLIDYFEAKCRVAEGTPSIPIDPADLRPALGYVNVVEPVDGGRDFRYRIFGTFVSAVTERDMTGQLLSELPDCDHIVDYAMAAYRAVMARRLPLLSQRIPLVTKETNRWERLVLPFLGPDSVVSRLVIGVVPLTLAGRPMRPAVLSGA